MSCQNSDGTAAAWALDLGPVGFQRAAHVILFHQWHAAPRINPQHEDIGGSGLGMAVVGTSFAGDGRPEAGWSDLQIRHLVPAASWGDRVAGENRADDGRWRRFASLP